MSSVRPKLKFDVPKGITAWDAATGRPVWLTKAGTWSEDPSQVGAFIGEAAEARLAEALRAEHIVTDPYFMEVTEDGAIAGRETLREGIRARGPTIGYGLMA